MLRSLHEGTAALPDQGGDFFDYPTQTVDAIASGCQHAQAGAIERMYAHESGVVDDLTCLLSGGAARAVIPRLDDPAPVPREPGARGLYRVSMST
jgi:type III pantothenate kinase